MKYRDSSNHTTHFESDVLAGARAANENAVRIYGNSSGNSVGIEAVGDSTAVSIEIKAKGSGSVKIGSTAGVTLGSTSVLNSSASAAKAVQGIFQSTIAFTQAAISSGQVAELTIASTTADVQPKDFVNYYIDWAAAPAGVVLGGYRLSTAAASRLTLILANVGSTATATLSGVATISWIDLT